ncbi:MAG: hypothetical protein P8J79_14225 [Halioglobus sp.]|nr:hypothetical protein [Halioglobus sp.]
MSYIQPLQKPAIQPSKLLPFLFKHVAEGELVTVFHIGPALPETVNFFSNYRCKVYFIDLFSAIPLACNEDATDSLEQQLEQVVTFPSSTRFDICLFWDLFNYLNSDAIAALLKLIRPHLKPTSVAHAFSVHNPKTLQNRQLYGIQQLDALSLRARTTVPHGYAPHSQKQLKQLLHCFRLERSVLLADSRLELLLHASL